MSKRGTWRESFGPHGARVTVGERRRGGNVYLFYWNGRKERREKRSLRFKVRDADGELIDGAVDKAKKKAKKVSNTLIDGELPSTGPDRTVGRIFDLFRREQLHGLSESREKDLRRALEMWEAWLGRRFDLSTFDRREWDAFARERGSGAIDARGRHVPAKSRREVGPRTVGKDLGTLRQVCRFAEGTRDRESAAFLLDRDPTRGLKLPREKSPSRPVARIETFRRLLSVADRIEVGHGKKHKARAPLRELLILSAHTGRRIGAIVALRWSDWRPSEGPHGVLRWRADSDKSGAEHIAEVTPEVRQTLQAWRQEGRGDGEWIFPAPESDGHVRADVAGRWLREAEAEGKVWRDRERPDRWGWHAFRRMWATARKHLPDVDVAEAGGWADPAVMRQCYQHADRETTRRAILEVGGPSIEVDPRESERAA